MEPRLPWCLLLAGMFALPAAVLAQSCLPAAALFAVCGLGFALATTHRYRLAGLCALPALLAAIPPREAPLPLPRPGPVMVSGVVAGTLDLPMHQATLLLLQNGSTPLRLYCTGRLEVLPGDRIQAIGNLAEAAVPGLPPSLHSHAAAVTVVPGRASLPRWLHAARRACERELLRLVPGDNGRILATLVLGRGTQVPRDVTEAHQATGLSHLLAVSGAHAAMLAFLLGLGGVGRGRRLAASRRHITVALGLLFLYAGITGGEPPVLRAVVMYALGAMAVQLGRPLALATGLLVPALATALIEPAAVLGPSFLLSYAAVFGLSLTRSKDQGRLHRWLLIPLSASFWATCTTAPITLWWFGQIAPWTIVLTPLLAPVVGLLLLLGLAGAVLGCAVPALADPLGPLLDGLTELYVGSVELADHLPFTPVRALCQPHWALLATTGIVAMCLLLTLRNRRAVALAVLALALPYFTPLPTAHAARLQLFAVGHGQACLFTNSLGERVVLDCGSLQLPHLAARKVLDALHVRSIAWLVITHGDQDHHNGVRTLLQRATVQRALLPYSLARSPLADLLRQHGADIRILCPGERADLVAELAVAAPRLPQGASSNDQSLWATIETGDTRVLLTGDAEVLGVAAAIAQGLASPCDVLVLPHHGRGNPAAPALLRAVQPTCCFASAAQPDGETQLGLLARRTGRDLWVTGIHGDVDLELCTGADGRAPSVQSSLGRRTIPPRHR